MSKGKDSKKMSKKVALKTAKQKREEKKQAIRRYKKDQKLKALKEGF